MHHVRHQHHSERGSHGSHVTDRDCRLRPGNLKQKCRPHPRWRLLLSPCGVVLLVTLHLHCTGDRRSSWGVVLLRPPTPRSTVVGGRRQCCSDAPLLVSPPRAEPSLPPSHRDSSRGGSLARLIHVLATQKNKDHKPV